MKLMKITTLMISAAVSLTSIAPVFAGNYELMNDGSNVSETTTEVSTEVTNGNSDDSDYGIMPLVGCKYKVIANNVNVRKSPSTSATILGQMNWGDVCYEINPPENHNGTTWVYVTCGSPLTGVKGYIAYQYLQDVGY